LEKISFEIKKITIKDFRVLLKKRGSLSILKIENEYIYP